MIVPYSAAFGAFITESHPEFPEIFEEVGKSLASQDAAKWLASIQEKRRNE